MKSIIKDLGINEEYTKAVRKEKKFTHIKDNIPLKTDFNFMADILYLPETKQKYKYLLTMCDLATDEFDFEPMKTQEPSETLSAMQNIFKRQYLKKPYATIATDGGTEFKGVFTKWLFNESIYHKVAEPFRHKQMSSIENLNKQLGRILNGYMNT